MLQQLLRIDTGGARKKNDRLLRGLRANDFRALLMEYLRKTLTTAAQMTPTRDLGLIQRNQSREYDHRINWIPSYHSLENPSLRVNEDGEHWIYCDGKWYNGAWDLPDNVYAQYQGLIAERNRRMRTPRGPFIRNRAQARYLYRKSWSQVGESVGVNVPVGVASKSFSRHNPPKDPPRGYGIVRGGKQALSVEVRNPFLLQPSRYISFSARNIAATAAQRHRKAFLAAVDKQSRATIKRLQ